MLALLHTPKQKRVKLRSRDSAHAKGIYVRDHGHATYKNTAFYSCQVQFVFLYSIYVMFLHACVRRKILIFLVQFESLEIREHHGRDLVEALKPTAYHKRQDGLSQYVTNTADGYITPKTALRIKCKRFRFPCTAIRQHGTRLPTKRITIVQRQPYLQ